MLCSVPATKSGSCWLDRLRSNKGFPSADNLHLDDILSRPTNSSSELPPAANASASTESTRPTRDNNQGEAFLGLMSDVLSELFFMDGAGESLKLSGKKIPRKQTNPRVCVNSNSNADVADGDDNENGVDIDNVNSSFVGNEKELENVGSGGGGECEEEEEKEEMRGYSMSELTVIDTSCGVWKTDKVVFRRKNVWKVREKKAKVRSFWRHKRKVGNEEVNGGDIDKKKAKVSVSGLEEADHRDDEFLALKSTEGQKSQNDTNKVVSEGMPDNLNDRREQLGKRMHENKSKDIRKGFRLNRSPRKLKKGDSSVVVIKCISTDNRNGGKLHKKPRKDSQEHYKT